MSSNELDWNSPLKKLLGGRKSKTIDKLNARGVQTLYDLLWILPLKTLSLPLVQSFDQLQEDSLFKGVGKVLGVRDQPNFKAMGKGRVPLSNVTLTVQDRFSSNVINLKWFNCYPSQVKTLKESQHLFFTGTVSSFMSEFQIIAPETQDLSPDEFKKDLNGWRKNDQKKLKVIYPTIDGISPHHILGLFEKIPSSLWQDIPSHLPPEIMEKRNFLSLDRSFRVLHGKISADDFTPDLSEEARQRLIYQEFFQEQVKIKIRKKNIKLKKGVHISPEKSDSFSSLFPYQLTDDQLSALDDISKDMKSGHPMMRLIQGDVGSGKTSVALVASLIVASQGYQTAIMCPTESLALQHFLTFQELINNQNQLSVTLDILIGSQSKKEKEQIYDGLLQGKTQIIIGTHALIQETVEFSQLGLAIIDEQHKFGVDQRLKLSNKGVGVHCLLMTATPIPRSLSLTQYGDLDISIIKQMPSNRKGTQTRIVGPATYAKYLSFLKTRISMGEQAYVVVPAIEDNPEQDMLNLEVVLKKYHEYFPQFKIEGLHGKMKAEEKNTVFVKFRDKKVDLLISTSVIEVGINNPNATVMTILNPERFGLSSLHQMRGRVGRGEKPGFCFLVNDKEISGTSRERLSVIENNTDGFKIAEEDLRIRGEGDLFGKDQSGVKATRVLSSLLHHQKTLEMAKEDVEKIDSDYPDTFNQLTEKYGNDDLVTKTV